ncbi:MAG: ABC transporter substrate-binding protein [Bacteroidota bacterium]
MLTRISFIVVFLLACSVHAQVTLTDDLGRAVELSTPPQHIVSLAPSITETLFAIGAGDQVAGVTDYCNYPEETKVKARVGGVINPSIETVVGVEPDLIILSMEGNMREDFARLTSLNVPVFVTNPRNMTGIYKSITDLGALTRHKDEADELVASMQLRERRITAPAHARVTPKVLMIVALQPLIVVGSKTFLAELLEMAGGGNIAASSPATYPTYSRESVVVENPDVLIVMSDAMRDPDELLSMFPEWATINAVRNNRVARINSDIVSRPGPRAIDALELLDKIIHEGHE